MRILGQTILRRMDILSVCLVLKVLLPKSGPSIGQFEGFGALMEKASCARTPSGTGWCICLLFPACLALILAAGATFEQMQQVIKINLLCPPLRLFCCSSPEHAVAKLLPIRPFVREAKKLPEAGLSTMLQCWPSAETACGSKTGLPKQAQKRHRQQLAA